MSFYECILNSDILTDRQREALINEYNDLVIKYSETMGDVEAAMVAASMLVAKKKSVLVKRARNKMIDVIKWKELAVKISENADIVREQKTQAGNLGFLWGGNTKAQASRSLLGAVYYRVIALEDEYFKMVSHLVDKYGSKMAGLKQDYEGFTKVVAAIIDGNTGGTGKTAAEARAVKDVLDIIHKDFIRAGGIIHKLDNYFPQRHNPKLFKDVRFEEWLDFIWDKLDRTRMVDDQTGLPMSDKLLKERLKEVFLDIKTNGIRKLEESLDKGGGVRVGGSGMAERHEFERFIHFKDSSAFLAYNSRFGYGETGLFDALGHYITAMARDIAIMEELGPKASSQIERIINFTRVDEKPNIQAERVLRGMYDVLSGRTGFFHDVGPVYASVMGVMNWMRAVMLGSAFISSLGDSFYVKYTAKLNGLDSIKALEKYTSLLNPLDDSDRRMARRAVFVNNAAIGSSLRHSKWIEDVGNADKFSGFVNFTVRATGLAHSTWSARTAVPMELAGFMAEARHNNLEWSDLPDTMKERMVGWGMDETDYKNIISSEPFIDPEFNADFITPTEVLRAGHTETARKYSIWFSELSQLASNEPQLLTRAITSGAVLGDASRGTALRATAGALMMFKSFGITVINNHLLPALRYAAYSRSTDSLARIGELLLGTAVAGAVTYQLKQVIAGKTPADMAEHPVKFGMAALLQGGGLGIFGDFLFSDYSRTMNGFVATLAGPVPSFAGDVYRAFMGNFDRMLDSGKESKFLADIYQLAESKAPFKFWYTRIFIERLLLDQLERAIDPNFDKRISRVEKKIKREYGQEFYWRPGDIAPGG
ncbi:MAG: hypothetical protein CUN56_00500 [Phototrophicales bacterium]|nr:MAG: hypothetical protein CUN56_00500 [Phototrophicales bacterium]